MVIHGLASYEEARWFHIFEQIKSCTKGLLISSIKTNVLKDLNRGVNKELILVPYMKYHLNIKVNYITLTMLGANTKCFLDFNN